MILNNRVGRTMMEHRSQYVGTFLLIVVSCLLFTMFNLLSSNMQDMTASFERGSVQEDASFTTGAELTDIAGLEAKYNALIEQSSSFDYALTGTQTLRVFSENTKVNIPAIIEGQKLSGGDILLDPNFAKTNGYRIGVSMTLADTSFRVAGFMSLPNYIYPLKSENDIISAPEQFGVAVISKADFAAVGRGSKSYAIKFNSRENIENQEAQFRKDLGQQNIPISRWTDIGDNKRVTFVTVKLEGIDKISTAMPVAILLLTCILAGIVIWRLLKQESAIIGTLYALGYRRREITNHYLSFSLWIALVGGVVGTAVGYVLVAPMVDFMVTYFNLPVTAIRLNIGVVALSVLLPVLFLGLSGWFVLRRALRYSPVELIRGTKEKTNINFIERNLKLSHMRFARKFRLREQLRSLSRTVFLLLGVALATMLLLLGFTAQSSLNSLLKDMLPSTLKFQYEYVYNTLHLEQNPAGTERYSAGRFTTTTNRKKEFEISGIQPDTKFIALKDQKGNELGKNQVILTKPLAERLKVVPGDQITVVNTLDSREYPLKVEGVADTYIGEMIFMPLDQFNGMLALPKDSYLGIWSNEKLDIPEQQLYRVSTLEDSIAALDTLTQPLQKTFGVISFLSFIIGLIVIYVVTSLIIEENKETISLMKVFGYRKKEVNSLILNCSTIIVVIGFILGIPLILSSLRALYGSLTQSIDVTLPVSIQPGYILVGFAVVYLTYEVSKLMSRKKISRISMSEALKASME